MWQLSAALLQNAPPEISKRACFDTVGAYRREWSKWDTSGEYGLEFAGIIGAITRRRVRATEASRLGLCQRVQDASNTIRALLIPRMRPHWSILTGCFDCSGCGDCTSCPPFKMAEMSNSEPSAIVLQGIPCIRRLYKFDSNGENGSLKVRRDSPFPDRA